MGWDAYAEPFKGLKGPNCSEGDSDFARAHVYVSSRGLMVDGLLRHGGLDVSTCGQFLQQATGHSVYGDSWSSEDVKEYNFMADWSFEVPKENEWAKQSAYAFLKMCAELGRGIRFSW